MNMLLRPICFLLAFPFLAFAGQKTSSQLNVSPDYAKRLGELAIDVAKDRGLTVTVAVSDADGFLLYLQTMDGAKRPTVRNAVDKSHTSALKRRNSAGPNAKPAPKGQLSPHSPFIGRFVVMRGGAPIMHEGVVIGGIGVSGATGAEDEEISLAAIEKAADSR